MLRLELGLLILGATASVVTTGAGERVGPIVSACVLLAGVFITLAGRQRRYEPAWFRYRAVVETTKSLSWRFMVGARPFEAGARSDAAAEFREQLTKIVRENGDVAVGLVTEGDSTQISERMLAVRAASVTERAALYVEHRFEDQIRWYTSRAAANERSEARWFFLALGLQALAVVAATLTAIFTPPARVVAIITTVASAVVAWSKARRFRENASAYAVTAVELSLARVEPTRIGDEQALSSWVEKVEPLISREHTLWRARGQ